MFLCFRFRKFRILWLRLKGSNEQKELEKKIITGQVWEDFCDTLKAAGTALLAPGAPLTPFDQAEGIRYLTRLLRSGLVNKMEILDWNKPKFAAVVNGWAEDRVTMFSENPDNLYLSAGLCSRFAYKMRVKRNSVAYLGFCTQQGKFGGEGGLETVDEKEFQQSSPDEVIEILLAAEKCEKTDHFLKLNPHFLEANIVLRNNFKNRSEEMAAEVLSIIKIGEFSYNEDVKTLGSYKKTFNVEEIANSDMNELFTEQDKLTCEHVRDALEGTGAMVAGASMVFAKWAYDFQKKMNKFEIIDPKRAKIGGDPNVKYYYCYWKMKEGECLIVKNNMVECYNWNLQVNNHWFESLDYRYFRVHVHKEKANYEADGSVVIVISLKNPKEVLKESIGNNWLTTTGHLQGVLTWRWIKAVGTEEQLPVPTVTVCDFIDLPKILET